VLKHVQLEPFLFVAVNLKDEDITERSSLVEAGLKAGISEETVTKMADAIATDSIKEKLKEQTQEALDLGVSVIKIKLRFCCVCVCVRVRACACV